MRPRAGLDVMEKRKISCPYTESKSDPSVVQLAAESLDLLSYPGSSLQHDIINIHEFCYCVSWQCD
jgi:hypothetical protein